MLQKTLLLGLPQLTNTVYTVRNQMILDHITPILYPRRSCKGSSQSGNGFVLPYFHKAREWGHTALQNPYQGVKGSKEVGRSRYITDAEFDLVIAQAHFTVIDAMDLALLTGI